MANGPESAKHEKNKTKEKHRLLTKSCHCSALHFSVNKEPRSLKGASKHGNSKATPNMQSGNIRLVPSHR